MSRSVAQPNFAKRAEDEAPALRVSAPFFPPDIPALSCQNKAVCSRTSDPLTFAQRVNARNRVGSHVVHCLWYSEMSRRSSVGRAADL